MVIRFHFKTFVNLFLLFTLTVVIFLKISTVEKSIEDIETSPKHQTTQKTVRAYPFITRIAMKNQELDTGMWFMDTEKIFTKPNYSFLNQSFHVSKLISTFQCSNESLKLLILVTSAVSNFKRRETVRKTWGKTLQTQVNNDFKTFFAVGKTKDKEIMKKVNDESAFYKDIIFGDFYEIFYNLPFKVETGFEWAYKHCSFDYYLKADDDVFVNLSNLFELLNSKNTPKKKLFLGLKHFGAKALRSGKYKVTFEEYSEEYYPEFCSGGGFIFSADVVKNVIPYFYSTWAFFGLCKPGGWSFLPAVGFSIITFVFLSRKL